MTSGSLLFLIESTDLISRDISSLLLSLLTELREIRARQGALIAIVESKTIDPAKNGNGRKLNRSP